MMNLIKKFVTALKTSRTARFTLIAIIILTVPLCILGQLIGIPAFIIIFFLLASAMPLVCLAGGVGAAIGVAGTLKANKSALDKTQQDDPELADLERERGRLQTINIAFWIAAIGVSVLLIAISSGIGFYIWAAAAACFYFFWLRKQNDAFNDSFKKRIVLSQLNKSFQNVDFEPDNKFDEKEIGRISPFSFNQYNGDDWIEADRGGLHFCRSDISLNYVTETTDSDGSTSTSVKTLFSGALVRIACVSPYQTVLFVSTKKFHSGIKPNIETESIEFNNRLEAYADDQHNARLLLTPQLIEKLINLDEKAAQSFSLTFSDKYLYAFLRSPEGNSFEMNIKKDANILELKNMVDEQISRLCAFLDALELPGAEQ